MGYVDLRKQGAERAQDRRMLEGFQRDAGLYLSMAAGVVFGILASFVFLFVLDPFLMGLLSPLLPIAVLATSIVLAAFLALAGNWQLRHHSLRSVAARFGQEKQLLMAIQEAGGSITPIEAALQTSLTVDEADEILSRFAARGHLLVENRDGVLSYALPGKRIGGP